MDPTITYIEMLDETAEPGDRVLAAVALQHWIRSGGFLPLGAERREVVLNIETTLLLAVAA